MPTATRDCSTLGYGGLGHDQKNIQSAESLSVSGIPAAAKEAPQKWSNFAVHSLGDLGDQTTLTCYHS